MTEKPKFWVVWSPRGGRPYVRHASHDEAVIAAKRLADKLPGRHFYILEMVGYAINGPETLTKRQLRALAKATALAGGNQGAVEHATATTASAAQE